jgi:hypothetical protein
LKHLSVGYMNVSDLTFVSNLTELDELNIGMMPISSIEPLRSLLSPETVTLDRTTIVDISPLLDLAQLKKLSVVGSPARSDVRHYAPFVRELRERARWIMENGEGLEITGTRRAQPNRAEGKPN